MPLDVRAHFLKIKDKFDGNPHVKLLSMNGKDNFISRLAEIFNLRERCFLISTLEILSIDTMVEK